MTPDYDALKAAQFDAETRLPKLYKRDYGFSPTLLKSSVFRPAIGCRMSYPKDTPLVIKTATGDTVRLIGTELRQDDQTVLLAIIKEKAGSVLARSGTSSVSFVPRVFCREVLGWADGGVSVQKLLECLRRLKDTYLRIEYARGGEGTLSFVADYDAARGEEWSVYLSPRLVEVFAKQTTYLNVEQRKGLREGLQTWAFGFINADPCNEPFDLTALRELAGASGTEQKKFNQNLKAALEVLVERGVIAGFDMSRKSLTVSRH